MLDHRIRLFRIVMCVAVGLLCVACASERAHFCWTGDESRGISYLPRAPDGALELLSFAEKKANEKLRGSLLWFRGPDSLFLCSVPRDCRPSNCIAQRFDYRLKEGVWGLFDSIEVVSVITD